MGGKYVPEDSLQQTRARIGLIAEELSRRTTAEALEAEGRRLYEETKAKALLKADELKERAKVAAREKAEELKAQAKDQIRLKADQWKEQAMASPTTYAVVGALTGAAAGAAVGKYQSRERRSIEFDTLEFGGTVIGERERFQARAQAQERVGELREQAAGKLEDVKSQVGEKVDDLKERASSAVDDAKERVSSAVEDVKERASHLREHLPSMGEVRERSVRRSRDLFREQPILVACGAIALGALAAWLVPVTESERRLVEPLQSRAREGMRKVGEVVQEKISDVSEQVNEKIDQLGEQQQASAEDEHEAGEPYRVEGEPPAIH